MSVLAPSANEVFIIRTFKRISSSPGTKWANSYECIASDTAIAEDLLLLASSLVTYEAVIHNAGLEIYRYTVSTYVPDTTVPYNPENVVSVDFITPGQRTGSSDGLPLEIVVFAKRVTFAGRSGKIFYRGCLNEEDIQSVGGQISFTPSALTAINTRFQSAISAAQLTRFLAGGDKPVKLCLARGSPTPTNVRPVTTIVPFKPSFLRTDYRFYNRSSN